MNRHEPSEQETPHNRVHPRTSLSRRVGQVAGVLLLLAGVYLAVGLARQTWFAQAADPRLEQLANIQKNHSESESTDRSTEGAEQHAALPGILAGISETAIAGAAHPLDPLLEVAELAQARIRESIRDYQAVMVNQVRLGKGKPRDPQFMQIKIRHERSESDGRQVPFSVYTKFLQPTSLAGQEAIWVKGANDGHLIGHPPSGMLNLMSVHLDPTGAIAMKGNRYPIYEMGFARLLEIIIEKGRRDRAAGGCEVRLERDVLVDNRPCIMLEIKHPQRQEPFDFHIARIFIDTELQIPVAYEGYDWPEQDGGEPLLLEKYVYTQIVLNPGLSDLDFDPSNPDYDYPDR